MKACRRKQGSKAVTVSSPRRNALGTPLVEWQDGLDARWQVVVGAARQDGAADVPGAVWGGQAGAAGWKSREQVRCL